MALLDSSSNILSDVEITGSISFKGDLTFDGKVEKGEIKGTNLTVGPNAKINGNVEADALIVHGTVNGDALVIGKCELKGSARLVGSITAKRLVMDDGATLIGQAEITPDSRGSVAL